MSLWEMSLGWMGHATAWDWFWHIVAALLVVVFSVPHIFWRWLKPLFKKGGDSDWNIDTKQQC